MTIKLIGLTDDVQNLTAFRKINSVANRKGINLYWLPFSEKVFESLDNRAGTILLVAVSLNSDNFKLVKEISLNFPSVSIILITDHNEYDLKTILRSGIADIINLSANEQEIIDTIQEVEKNLLEKLKLKNGESTRKRQGKIITVCSMKGGVGKTTISINLATAMVKNNLKVAIIDMDLQSGDVALLFDIKPKISIYDWVKADKIAQEKIEQYMLKHGSGVDILAAPIRLELAEEIKNNHIKSLLTLLKKHYDIVVIDTPPHLLDNELVILEQSDDILVVANNDLPTLKNSKIYLNTLKALGIQNKVKVILNRDTRSSGISKANVQNIIGYPIFADIPNEEKIVISSVNKGIPFVTSDNRSKVSKSIFTLASKLLIGFRQTESNSKNEKKSIFKKASKVRG